MYASRHACWSAGVATRHCGVGTSPLPNALGATTGSGGLNGSSSGGTGVPTLALPSASWALVWLESARRPPVTRTLSARAWDDAAAAPPLRLRGLEVRWADFGFGRSAITFLRATIVSPDLISGGRCATRLVS